MGAKPIQLHFNGRCGLALAFDVGYNYVAGMLAYLDGEVIRLEERKIPQSIAKISCPLFKALSPIFKSGPSDAPWSSGDFIGHPRDCQR